jgi:hypothetical protein
MLKIYTTYYNDFMMMKNEIKVLKLKMIILMMVPMRNSTFFLMIIMIHPHDNSNHDYVTYMLMRIW